MFSPTYIFDEDTGEIQFFDGMGYVNYDRPQMVLVDHDFCQQK